MHITFITPFPSDTDQHGRNTGVGSYSMYLVKALAGQGHTIDVYAHDDGVLVDESRENIRVFRVWKRSIGGVFSLLRRIMRDRPKILHIQHEVNSFGSELTLPFTPFIPAFARLLGARVITTFHGGTGLSYIDRDFVRENGKNLPPWIIRFSFRYIFGLFSYFSDQIIVHEPFQKEELVHEHGIHEGKISVIPHGVPENPPVVSDAREQLGITESKKIFLFMGFAARYKGLSQLYESYVSHIKDNPDTLLILGAGPAPRLESDPEYMGWYDMLRDLFSRLGENVRWLGFIPGNKIALYYSVADAILFPYSRRIAASGPMALAIGYEKDIIVSSILQGKKEYHFDFDDPVNTQKWKQERGWNIIALQTLHVYEK